MRTQKCSARGWLLGVLLVFATGLLPATPPSGPGSSAIGIRLGFSGAPNGLTFRKIFAFGHAFEVVAGYNGRVGRTLQLPFGQRGNSFVGISYAPFVEMGDSRLGVALTGDVGLRARYHHYRRWATQNDGGPITPEPFIGGGLQLEFNDSVQLFADLHAVLFNRYDNRYVPGVESGLGIRFVI